MYVFNENGKAYVACSQNTVQKIFNSVNLITDELVNAENLPFWKVKGVKNCIMLVHGEMRIVDKIRFEKNLFDEGAEITGEYIVNKIVPKLNKLLKGVNEKNEEVISYCCVILKDDNIFYISSGMVEMVDYYAITSGGDVFMGSQEIMKDVPVYERISKVAEFCEKIYGDCIFPICVMDTESEEFKVIKRGDYNESGCSL